MIMKITEKEIRDIVRSELELNEGLFDFKDSPVLQGLGIVKPRTEEEKKQAEIDKLKRLLPPATQDTIDTKTAARASSPTNPAEFFTYHQLDVEEFIRDLIISDIEPQTKIYDNATDIVYYDGSGTHNFSPDEIQILRKDYIDKLVKLYFKKYDLDEDGDYGDMGDIEVALSDELVKQTSAGFRGIPGPSNIEWMMKPISSNTPNKQTLENIRTRVCKTISEYIKDKFKDMSPESGEYFLTDNNDLGWRKQFAVCIPRDIQSILDGSSNFLDWAANDPLEWEKILASDMNIPFADIIKARDAQRVFGVIGCIVTIIYDLDLPIDELEDPNLSSAAITQRNMDKIKSELERQEAMIDYEAQEKFQVPDIELETFSKRKMFDFTKQHPYLWKDFKSLMITARSDLKGTNEEINKLLISNSLKMYKELDLSVNSFFDQEKSEKEKREIENQERQRRKEARAEEIRINTEKNRKKREAAEAEAKAKRDNMSDAKKANIQSTGINNYLINDILSYKQKSSEDLQPFFKVIEAYKPVISAIVNDNSNPKSSVYVAALKGIKTRLKNLEKTGELVSLGGPKGAWSASPGYKQLLGLSSPIFEDLREELRDIEYHIEYQRHIASDPNLYVPIPPPFDKVTEYNLNVDSNLFDMRDLILDLK